MNKKYLITSIIALAVLATGAGLATTVMAADGTENSSIFGKFFGRRGGQAMNRLTQAQRTELDTKLEAVRSAIQAGDFNAWVTAEKAIDANSPILTKVTADNFSAFSSQEKQRQATRDEMQAKMEEVKKALESGDYDAWFKAEKAINENSLSLQKINSGNFGKYSEAFKLHEQAQSIMQDLGVDGQDFGGFGKGIGRVLMGGPGRGFSGVMGQDKAGSAQ
jgi:hypothetical protein